MARTEPAGHTTDIRPPPPDPPAEQLGVALVATMKTGGGTQSVTVHLRPEALGAVQIRIDRTLEGLAHVAISADRPETLRLLRDDAPGLHRVLDHAGLPTEGRTMSFDVPPPQPVSTPNRFDAPSHGFNGSTDPGGQHAGGNRHGESGPDRNPDPRPGQEGARPRWARAGLDIVA